MKSDPGRLADLSFWQALCPELTVSAASRHLEAERFEFSVETLEVCSADLRVDGYTQVSSVLPRIETKQLASCAAAIRERTGLAVFALVYDAFWETVGRLSGLLEWVLGGHYWVMPAMWVWHLDPLRSESGWRPHRDSTRQALRLDGTPNTLTVWIALTDATPLNGCMYVVPASRDPEYPRPLTSTQAASYSDIRALPVEAGTVLAWNQAVLHWGGRCSPKAAGPRASFAFEFQRADIPAMRPELISPDRLPGFDQRLQLIGRQILGYSHLQPPSDEMLEIAKGLVSGALKSGQGQV